jgi:hypothetical protein
VLENKENQLLAKWILELYLALSFSSGGNPGGRSTRAENKENQLVSRVNFGTLSGIVALFWRHHWRQVNSC